MKFTLVLFVAVVGLCLVYAKKSRDLGSENFKRHSQLMKFAKKSSENKLDSKERGLGTGGSGYCWQGKCPCDDWDLIGGYLSSAGQVLSMCQSERLWTYFFNLPGQSDAKRQNAPFYDDACYFMEMIGQAYENNELSGQISSCCEYQEGLLMFHCLDVYMTLHEMDEVEEALVSENKNPNCKKDLLVRDLEWVMENQCNALFRGPDCLVDSLWGDQYSQNCFEYKKRANEKKSERQLDPCEGEAESQSGSGSGAEGEGQGESGDQGQGENGGQGQSGNGGQGENGGQSNGGGAQGQSQDEGSGATSGSATETRADNAEKEERRSMEEIKGLVRQLLKARNLKNRK